ncbi:hypothetical protein J2Z17_003347 [Rhizobium halophytocola]|uniref:Transposase n=1 Tax=Rhizobium halophytocola TaxID=735519 RepID=A0ABS4E1S0_9HYPH|nr:hypothetical protein [Rhizobium halophytocola]
MHRWIEATAPASVGPPLVGKGFWGGLRSGLSRTLQRGQTRVQYFDLPSLWKELSRRHDRAAERLADACMTTRKSHHVNYLRKSLQQARSRMPRRRRGKTHFLQKKIRPRFSPLPRAQSHSPPFRHGYTTRRCGEAEPARYLGKRRRAPCSGCVENGLPPATRGMRTDAVGPAGPHLMPERRAGRACGARKGWIWQQATGRPAFVTRVARSGGTATVRRDKRLPLPLQSGRSHAQKPPNGTLKGAVFLNFSMGSFERPVRLHSKITKG